MFNLSLTWTIQKKSGKILKMQQPNTMQLLKIQKRQQTNANTLHCKKDSTKIQSNYLSAKCGKTKQIFIQRSKKQNKSSIISGWEGDWLIQEGTSYPAKITHNFLQAENYSIMNQHKLFLETTNIYEPLKKTEKCPQNVQKFYWHHINSTQDK